MRAIILAAGVGRRLTGSGHDGPKCLLRFAGQTLLERHLRCLGGLGVDDIRVCIGHQADAVLEVLRDLPIANHVRTVLNPDYAEGSIVSLWTMRAALAHDEPVILMDADVLYAPALLARLVTSPVENCFLVDRAFEPGDEPVKLCFHNGHPNEFRKRIAADLAYTWCGESVGFFRFTPAIARQLADRTEAYLAGGRREEPYEEAIRDELLAAPDCFGAEDITGLPWIEIDFPDDITRARDVILPRIHGN